MTRIVKIVRGPSPRITQIFRGIGAKGDTGDSGNAADVLAYLQSLPTTPPSQPNMPWWDNNVLKRSAVALSLFVIQSGIWVDSGTWIDSETWSDN